MTDQNPVSDAGSAVGGGRRAFRPSEDELTPEQARQAVNRAVAAGLITSASALNPSSVSTEPGARAPQSLAELAVLDSPGWTNRAGVGHLGDDEPSSSGSWVTASESDPESAWTTWSADQPSPTSGRPAQPGGWVSFAGHSEIKFDETTEPGEVDPRHRQPEDEAADLAMGAAVNPAKGAAGNLPKGAAAKAKKSAGRRQGDASPPDRQAQHEDDSERAHELVVRRLSLRPHSRAELRSLILAKGIDETIADDLLARFSELQLVDDDAFAQAWVESRHRSKQISRRVLSAELRRKGIDDLTSAEALSQIDDEDELEAARAIATKKLRTLARLDPEVRKRRLYGALARRGYSTGICLTVVRECLAGDVVVGEQTDWQ